MRKFAKWTCGMALYAVAAGGAMPEPWAASVTALRAFRDDSGRIATEVTLTALDARAVPVTRVLVVAGGELDGVGERSGDAPRFLLNQRGKLSYATDTGLPVWTPDGRTAALAEAAAGGDPVPYWNDARFVACDRGDPILYRVDTNALPAGITPARALQAVAPAFGAWTNVCTVRFQFDGTEPFGAAAPNLGKSDRRIWIQLYNYGNYIASGATLGVGGYGYAVNAGGGGQIAGANFNPSTWGYVIINHTQAFFSNNPINLEEVLTHEIGHVLSLDHSADPNSIMYPTVAGNGRGARLVAGDVTRVLAMYPSNTPPYALDRVLYVLTRPGAQLTPGPGTNGVVMRGFDLQTTNLTMVYHSSTAGNGTFATNGNVVGFTPAAYYNAAAIDPATSSYYDYYQYCVSDGTNRSAPARVRVLAYYPDSDSDFLPDSWEALYPGLTGGANGDPDGDGVTNYQEWMLGSDPLNRSSSLLISAMGTTNLTWGAKPYELYEVQVMTNLVTGFTTCRPVVPTSTTGSVAITSLAGGMGFFRVQRIP
jgi:hypothetical protein